MYDRRLRTALSALLLLWANLAGAVTTTVKTDAAWAVLDALQNPSLTVEEARKIAELHGNQGVIKKLQEFKIAATEEGFANALVASAHGLPPKDFTEQNFLFDMVKAKVPRLRELLNEMKATPEMFQGGIGRRIDLYSPKGTELSLNGYVVAAGDGGGYAFGDTDFFINIGIIDELVVIRSVTTHELYHAVQGAYSGPRKEQLKTLPGQKGQLRITCQATVQLFDNIYREGSAVEVADVSAIKDAKSEIGIKMRTQLAENVRRVKSPTTLLEMSVLSISGANALDYHDVYDVGFLGSGPLYAISYVMAKAIADSDGPQGLAEYVKKPAYEFVLRYTKLPLYGADAMHPTLGKHTVDAAQRLAHGCS